MKKVKRLVSMFVAGVMVFGCTVIASAAEAGEVDASEGNKLKITADHANVDVQFASDGQYSFDYDSSKFTVTAATDESTFEIIVSADLEAIIGFEDRVTVYIPDQTYDLITGISEKGGLHLPEIDADITITNNAGAASVRLPSDYCKTLNYTGISGAGSLVMNNNTDFSVNVSYSVSAVSGLRSWPMFGGSGDYIYRSGDGTAKINVALTKCAFSFYQQLL